MQRVLACHADTVNWHRMRLTRSFTELHQPADRLDTRRLRNDLTPHGVTDGSPLTLARREQVNLKPVSRSTSLATGRHEERVIRTSCNGRSTHIDGAVAERSAQDNFGGDGYAFHAETGTQSTLTVGMPTQAKTRPSWVRASECSAPAAIWTMLSLRRAGISCRVVHHRMLDEGWVRGLGGGA